MTPLLTFLNSGVNIELVYVILAGISTQFSEAESSEATVTEMGDDKVITLSNYTIHNIDLWRNNPSKKLKFDYLSSSRIDSKDSKSGGGSLVINSTVSITLHRVALFT